VFWTEVAFWWWRMGEEQAYKCCDIKPCTCLLRDEGLRSPWDQAFSPLSGPFKRWVLRHWRVLPGWVNKDLDWLCVIQYSGCLC
jgi:hypothetical protein